MRTGRGRQLAWDESGGEAAGPVQGSRLENRTYLGWFCFLLAYLTGTLTWFLLGYFGWSDYRAEHQVLPSLLRAVVGGAFFGLIMTAFFEWQDRRADRE
jgi:hypothetical protein